MNLAETETSQQLRRDRRRASVLAVVLVIQTLASIFFIADVGADLRWGGLNTHSGFEAMVAVALLAGTVFGAVQMRQILNRIHQAEAAMSIVSGALSDLIETHFKDWGLTPAESEVALFTLKGLDVADIARLRGAASGTVRAQLTKVYSKAGVSGRGQLTSMFIEDLLESAGPEPTTGSHSDHRPEN